MSSLVISCDATKSIGTNVSSVSGDTNELDCLVLGMERIQRVSARSERLLRESRKLSRTEEGECSKQK